MLFRLVNLKLFNMNRKYYLLVIFAFILSCEKDDDHDDHDDHDHGMNIDFKKENDADYYV